MTTQVEITSAFLLTSHFCIDCSREHPPIAMSKIDIEVRKKFHMRILNTQPILLAIEQVFQQAAESESRGAFDLDIQLLKKVIPQLNTSYERKYQRLPSVRSRQIKLVDSVSNIHKSLKKMVLNMH